MWRTVRRARLTDAVRLHESCVVRSLLSFGNPTVLATVSNRRNFYRLLRVQPDAALITNAYATLSDARLRDVYDARRLQRRANAPSEPSAHGAALSAQ